MPDTLRWANRISKGLTVPEPPRKYFTNVLTNSRDSCSIENVRGNDRARPDATRHLDDQKLLIGTGAFEPPQEKHDHLHTIPKQNQR